MPTHALAERPKPKDALEKLERVVILGDLSALTEPERIGYYARVCESLGLNPLTRPFEYIPLNGKLTLYARRDATDQLRKVNGISVDGIERDRDADLALAIVTVRGHDRSGRTDSAVGAVSIKGLSGELLANALMKAETKAKRRFTLSLAGLGWLDESEIEDVVEPERRSLLDAIADRTKQFAATAAPAYFPPPTYEGTELYVDDLGGSADSEAGLPDIDAPAADKQGDMEASATPAAAAGPTLDDILAATGGTLEGPAEGPAKGGGMQRTARAMRGVVQETLWSEVA